MTATEVVLGPVTEQDIHALARLHQEAFPGYFLSSLGEPFLALFYRGFLREHSALTVVARSSDCRLLGVVVGTTAPAGFFRRLLVRHWAGFALASARAVLARPTVAPRLLRAVRYRGGEPGPDAGALLSSICVAPEAQGQGLGRRLIAAWTSAANERGAVQAHLTTDALGNDAVNRFYSDSGWVLTDCYRTHEGRLMNRYTRDLARAC